MQKDNNIYAPNNRASKYRKQNILKLQVEETNPQL